MLAVILSFFWARIRYDSLNLALTCSASPRSPTPHLSHLVLFCQSRGRHHTPCISCRLSVCGRLSSYMWSSAGLVLSTLVLRSILDHSNSAKVPLVIIHAHVLVAVIFSLVPFLFTSHAGSTSSYSSPSMFCGTNDSPMVPLPMVPLLQVS